MANKKVKRLKNMGEVGSVKELKKSLKRAGSSGSLYRIPSEGRTVRFLTEPDKWVKYFEHYDDSRTGDYNFPCVEGDCEGCNDGLRASKRYLANALNVEDTKVIPLVLPSSLVSNLLKKYDKFGTMTDRDYELTKDGTGFDTEYDALYDGPTKVKIDRYELLDLENTLVSLLDSEAEDDDEDEDEKPAKKKKKAKDDTPPWEEPSKKSGDKPVKKKGLKKKPLSK